ncbi:MAG: PDZ domain-containing protein [Gammaproteobacteria bacterium]|nr:PDZ domain-containing protein [Gammaproteobacteria bacterium]
MNKTLLISSSMLAVGIGLGLGVQVLLRDDPPAALTPAEAVTTLSPALAPTAEITPVINQHNATDALQKEIAARQQLAQNVARLEKELHELKTQLSPQSTTGKPPAQPAAAPSQETQTNEPVFDEDALRAAGLSMTMVKQTRERFEQLEMDRLFLRDRAIREGWMGTVRYSNEVEKLEGRKQDINNSLGDDGYDAYLYATNQSNRVVIRDMLQGSPAKAAGLLPGDVVLSYDHKRMFATGDLQKATAGGKAGETVAVEILRNGQAMTLYLTRGPLGVYLDADSAKPQ